MTITHYKDYHHFKIYIDDILHLSLKIEDYAGVQSWINGRTGSVYEIELYVKGISHIVLGYDKKETWEKILKLIDQHL